VNFRHIGADYRIVARSYLRNPVALFFSLIFPIILIGLFGAIFSATGSAKVTVVVLNEDHNSFVSQEFFSELNNTSIVSLQFANPATVSPTDFASWLGQNSQPVGLVIPAGFEANYTAYLQNHSNLHPVSLVLYTNPEDAADSGAATGAVQGVANGFNLYGAGGQAVVTLAPPRNVGSQIYTYIDYLIPGLVGFSILTSPMFSMVNITSEYRKNGLLRQLSLTPLTRAEWLVSRIAWYIMLTFVTAGIMIGAGVFLFNAHVQITLGLVPWLVVGPFLFVALGMLAGSVARTPESAAVIGNIITFPMMFLSGTFFAVSLFPPWLQTVAHVLPLYYVIDGMNQVMLFQNSSRAFFDFVVVLAISLVFFVAAVRLFKWRDE